MKYSDKNPPLCCMQTMSRNYKESGNMTIRGILWHDTACGNPYVHRYMQPSDNAKDKDYWLKLLGKNQYNNDWNHWQMPPGQGKGVNGFLGKLADGSVAFVQGLPWNKAPWGCGGGSKGSCNDGWIQFEICDDGYKSKEYFEACYKEACEITAYLCKKYNIDPKGTVKYNGVTVPTILCHWDSYKLGLGCGHYDVYGWFDKFGKTMNDVRNDVAKLLGTQPDPKPEPTPTPTTNIVKGDLVQITGSTYYNSTKTIPNWAKADKWYVSSVNSSYVILGQNEKKNNNLDSKVAIKDVKKIGGNTPTPTPTPSKKGYTGEWPTTTVRPGDKGAEVKKVQQFLLWYDAKCLPKFGADSDYGAETTAAVKKFQTASKLTADGIFGPNTLHAAKKVTK